MPLIIAQMGQIRGHLVGFGGRGLSGGRMWLGVAFPPVTDFSSPIPVGWRQSGLAGNQTGTISRMCACSCLLPVVCLSVCHKCSCGQCNSIINNNDTQLWVIELTQSKISEREQEKISRAHGSNQNDDFSAFVSVVSSSRVRRCLSVWPTVADPL